VQNARRCQAPSRSSGRGLSAKANGKRPPRRTLWRLKSGSFEKKSRPYQGGLATLLFMCQKAFSVCYGFATDNCIRLRLGNALRAAVVRIALFLMQQLVYFSRRSRAVFFQTHRRKPKSKERYDKHSQVMTIPIAQ
jgi:hypothetical protein